jgi:hypothetical protein
MKQLRHASEKLLEHLIFALNHAMELKKDGVDPMMPFAIIMKGNEKMIKTFTSVSPDYADLMFEKTILEEAPDFVIYAYDTYIRTDDIRYDGVLLKAYDKTDSEIYLVGQKFVPKSENEEFLQIGNPAFLGTVANSFLPDPT